MRQRRRLHQAVRRRRPPTTPASWAVTRWPAPRARACADARADLFEGAAWYLTPGPRSSGILYERLHRLIVALGARPIAIDAGDPRSPARDRQPPAARARQRPGRPGRRRSQPRGRAAAANRPELPRRHARGRSQLGGLDRDLPKQRRGDRRRDRRGRGSAARDRRDAPHGRGERDRGVERRRRGGPPAAARGRARGRPRARAADLGAEPARGGGEGRGGARPRGREYRGHGARPGASTCDPGRSRSGSPATRAPGARPSSSRSSASRSWSRDAASTRRAAERHGHAATRQVDLPPRGAVRRHERRAGDDPAATCDAADTVATLDALRSLGAGVDEEGDDVLVRGVGLRTAARHHRRAARRAQRGHAAADPPGWLAGQPGGEWTLDGDESIRRRPGRPNRGSRCGTWGRRLEDRHGSAAAHGPRDRAERRPTTSCRWRARRSSRAC